ncbi:MAG: hypothetical protein WD824_21820 [Cyclobacteriaceae bacterium]
MPITYNPNFRLFLTLSLVLFFTTSLWAQRGTRENLSPKAYAESMINNPSLVENAKGENFCWHARVGMGHFIDSYELTKNTEWLDAGIKYYDFLVSKMDTDPDGYKGWIGPYGYDERFWQDSHVGDAILLTDILDFSVLVLEGKELRKKYGAKANEYVQLASKHFVEKYDKRDGYREFPVVLN